MLEYYVSANSRLTSHPIAIGTPYPPLAIALSSGEQMLDDEYAFLFGHNTKGEIGPQKIKFEGENFRITIRLRPVRLR